MGNSVRPIVAVTHPIVPGNDKGFVLKYADEMLPTDQLYVDPKDTAPTTAPVTRRGRGRGR